MAGGVTPADYAPPDQPALIGGVRVIKGKCAIGCGPGSPAVGYANLRGVREPVRGVTGVYPLCRHHYRELLDGKWGNVILDGWEEIPHADQQESSDPRGSLAVAEEREESGSQDTQDDPELI